MAEVAILGEADGMSSRAWMPLYVGDYMADTSHLSAEAHGVYLLLLMRCWVKGSIPSDRMQCMSIAHAMSEQSKSIVDAVIDEFFVLEEDGYHNKRIDIEREKAEKAYDKRAGAARKRWGEGGAGRCNADPMHEQPQPQPQPQPKPEPRQKNKALLTEIESIYDAYPKKTAKQDALRAIDKALRSVPHSVLLEAVTAYAQATATWAPDERQFIPNPATWFNDGRWEDDRATWASRSKQRQASNLTMQFTPDYYEDKA